MKNLTAALVLFGLATVAQAAELTERIDRTFDIRAGAKVRLTNTNGRIEISSWDQPRVRVIAEKRVEGNKNDLKRAMGELKVHFQQRDGGLTIETQSPRFNNGISSLFDWLTGDHINAQVRYHVTVPRNMNLDVENTNGSINVAGVHGEIEVETTNGKIDVAHCSGSIDASTTNGAISAELVRVAKGRPLRFETTNGRISVALPKDLQVDVDAGTTNGSIRSDLPVETTSFSRNSLRGSINGGGTPLRVRTTNGGIEIRTAGL